MKKLKLRKGKTAIPQQQQQQNYKVAWVARLVQA